MTPNGRKVYEQGGITPDIRIDEPRLTAVQQAIRRQRIVERFVTKLRATGFEMSRDQMPSEQVISRLEDFIVSEEVVSHRRLLVDDREFLKRSLATHLHISYFDYDEGLRVLAQMDPVVQQAQSLLGIAERMLHGELNSLSQYESQNSAPERSNATQ